MGFKLRRTNHATSLKPHAGDPDSQRGSSPIVTTGLTSSDALPLSTTSRTLSYARSGLDKQTPLNNITRALDIGGSTFTSYFMQSKNEQYWAMRSMLAETRLSERDRHQQELDMLNKVHESKIKRLEVLVVALITALIFIAVAVIVRDSRRSDDTGRSRGSFRPHLTVPILSPFTSFVENEASALGFRSTVVLMLIISMLLFGVFRYWLSRHR